MQISVFNNYELMSAAAAQFIISKLKHISKPLFCAASGDSPKGLYNELISQKNQNKFNVTDWLFLGLDEWVGFGKDDEGSCRYMLNRDLFHPLNLKERQIICFNGKAKNLKDECERIEDLIRQKKGIEVAVVGLGMNGHIGLNEPGTNVNIRSHVADLAEITKQTGQKYFSSEQKLAKGITLGIATLLEVKHLVLIVSGNAKALILKQVLEGEMTENIPASLLRYHKSFSVYLDAEAASLLKNKGCSQNF